MGNAIEFKRCYGCMRKLETHGGVCARCGYDNTTGPAGQPNHALPCGTVLNGRYVVGKELGQGCFGITYIGYNLSLEMPVCIKEYFPSGAMRPVLEISLAIKPRDRFQSMGELPDALGGVFGSRAASGDRPQARRKKKTLPLVLAAALALVLVFFGGMRFAGQRSQIMTEPPAPVTVTETTAPGLEPTAEPTPVPTPAPTPVPTPVRRGRTQHPGAGGTAEKRAGRSFTRMYRDDRIEDEVR